MKSLFNKSLGLVAFASLFLSACDDTNDWAIEGEARMFQPVTFEVGTSEANAVPLTFSKVQGAVLYSMELSKDSLEFVNIVDKVDVSPDTLAEDGGSSSVKYKIKIDGLEGSTKYSVRMQVLGDGVAPSKWVSGFFVTKGEQIFTAIRNDERTDKSVVLRWNAKGIGVTHIVLTNPIDETQVRIDLDATDIAASSKMVEQLQAATNYIAVIYNGENKRGELAFRTLAAIPEGSTLYVLDGTEDLKAFLETVEKSNITLMLPEGSTYKTEWTDPETGSTVYTLPIPDHITSLTLWGAEGVPAKINCTSIKLGTGIESLTFRNVEYHGNSSASDYVVNESTTRSLTEVLFEDAIVHTVRGVFRMQNAANYTAISTFTIRNSIVHTVGGYGVVNGETNVLFDEILMENSTFYAFDTFVTLKKQGTSIEVNNCTFNRALTSGKYFFSFNKDLAVVPPTFVMDNCVFGSTGVGTSETAQARGTNPKVTDTFVTNSYFATDFYIASGYPMSGLTEAYNGTSTDLFTDPDNGDFSFADSDFVGKSTAGDPRWH